MFKHKKFLIFIFSIVVLNCTDIAKYKLYDPNYNRKHTLYWSSTFPQITSIINFGILWKTDEIFFLKCLRFCSILGHSCDYKYLLKRKLKILIKVNIFSGYYVINTGGNKNKNVLDLLSIDFGIEWEYKKNKNWSGSFTLGHSFLGLGDKFMCNSKYQKNLMIDITLAKYERKDGLYIQFGRIRINVSELLNNNDVLKAFLIPLTANFMSCHVGININTIHRNRTKKELF